MTLVTHIVKDSLPIIGGEVTIHLEEYGLTVIVPVHQVKGEGTHDGRALIKFNKYHKPALRLLSTLVENSNFTANQYLYWLELDLIKNLELGSFGNEFKQANWRRPLSEFLSKGLVNSKRDGKSWVYWIPDMNKIKKILEQGYFD